MTSVTDAVSAIAAASNTSAAGATGSSNASATQLDKDLFLKLLVAQMKYQDPSNPTDANQFLAQTAQFSTVERLDQLTDISADMLAAQAMLGSSGLIGRTVTYLGAEGTDLTGVVTGTSFADGSVTLHIGDSTVPLELVKQVTETPSQA